MSLLKCAALLAACSLAACSSVHQATLGNQRIVFFGDSITEAGVKSTGYITLVSDSLHHRSDTGRFEVIGAGISGNRVPDLQARVDRDVIARKPTLVIIYIGINDVWHWALLNKGTPKDQFRSGLLELIGKIQTAGAAVILCTPSVIGEKHAGSNPLDGQLDAYAAITRSVAAETGARLLDLRKDFVERLAATNTSNIEKGFLTTDGVHLNDAGNHFVASEMLEAILNR